MLCSYCTRHWLQRTTMWCSRVQPVRLYLYVQSQFLSILWARRLTLLDTS